MLVSQKSHARICCRFCIRSKQNSGANARKFDANIWWVIVKWPRLLGDWASMLDNHNSKCLPSNAWTFDYGFKLVPSQTEKLKLKRVLVKTVSITYLLDLPSAVRLLYRVGQKMYRRLMNHNTVSIASVPPPPPPPPPPRNFIHNFVIERSSSYHFRKFSWNLMGKRILKNCRRDWNISGEQSKKISQYFT